MAFCKLISLLVESDLLHVETVYRKLVHSRENKNLDMSAKMMVNKILVKVLELLWENSISPEPQSYSLPRLLALVEDMASTLMTAVKTDQHNVLVDLAKLLKSTFGSVLNLDNFNQ
ncbi:unnamed protein product [Lymnaea stagnalis]|uniref:Uncharacterized protein n=1 Tax=Lymnaea stagnalis TaxID=6523 RepID=A0AAV2HJ13_LYMST